MAYSVIASVGGFGSGVGPIDTSGADLIVLLNMGDNATGWTDSKSNSYTSLTDQDNSGNHGRLVYAYAPTVGSGHTFSAPNGYSYIGAIALSGSVASPFDQQNGARGAAVTSKQPGSITPSEDNTVVIVGYGMGGSNTVHAIDGGFTKVADVDAQTGVNYGGFIGYLIQTSAAAANPTGSWLINSVVNAMIANFKSGAAAAGQPTWRRWGGTPFMGGQGIGNKGPGRAWG